MRLDLFINALASKFSFYVLGAGASAGIVPMTRELKSAIITRQLEFGSYEAMPVAPDDVSLRILGDTRSLHDPFEAFLLRRLYPSAVHAIALKALAPQAITNPAYQYQIFSWVPYPSVIFNMNVDGLAARYCRRHIVLDPHGTTPVHILRTDLWETLIDIILEFGFDVPALPGEVYLPKPETLDITKRGSYREALSYFPAAQFLLLIGYSFGRYKDSIDDSETFNFFTELLKRYPKPVLVVDPNPDITAAAIQETIRQKTVYAIPVYWNYLTKAIIEVAYKFGCYDIGRMSELQNQIKYRYDQLRNTAV
jgi:hypothetical protein